MKPTPSLLRLVQLQRGTLPSMALLDPLDPLDDLILLDDLFVKVRQRYDLKIEKRFDCLDVRGTSFHRFANALQHVPDAGLGILKLILDSLAIEIRQIGDGSDCCEDGVIPNPRRAWSERCNHSYTLLATEGC